MESENADSTGSRCAKWTHSTDKEPRPAAVDSQCVVEISCHMYGNMRVELGPNGMNMATATEIKTHSFQENASTALTLLGLV